MHSSQHSLSQTHSVSVFWCFGVFFSASFASATSNSNSEDDSSSSNVKLKSSPACKHSHRQSEKEVTIIRNRVTVSVNNSK